MIDALGSATEVKMILSQMNPAQEGLEKNTTVHTLTLPSVGDLYLLVSITHLSQST